MKKIVILLMWILSLLNGNFVFANECQEIDMKNFLLQQNGESVTSWEGIQELLTKCRAEQLVANETDEYRPAEGFKEIVEGLTRQITIIFSILAIGVVVYGSALMVVSTGNEERRNKGIKTAVWGAVWFLLVISVPGVISIIVNLIYSLIW